MTTEKKSLTRMRFEEIFGNLHLDPQDAARWFFEAGWNAALDEAAGQISTLPFEADTKASFALYFKTMKDEGHP